MHPIALAIAFAVVESTTFYVWHWPDRQLLPERFRGFLLAKGLLKSVAYLAITFGLTYWHELAGWIYAISQPIIGLMIHYRTCRRIGVNPVNARPRDRYVAETANWVNALIEKEAQRKEKR